MWGQYTLYLHTCILLRIYTPVSLPNAPEPGYNFFPGRVGGNLLEGYSKAGRVGDTLFVVFELNLEAVDKLWRE